MIDTLRYIWNHPLARHSRVEAISRYFRWQIGARILGWPSVAPFVDGANLVVEPGMHGATGNLYCGLHEFPDMAFLLHFLRPGDLFVDAGANIGSYTVLASAVVGARTLSIEPVQKTFELLERNIRINDIAHLATAVNCALGRCEEVRTMSLDLGTQNKVVSGDYEGDSTEILVRPLDALLAGQPAIMWKVDVEGFEPELLQGAQRSICDEALQAILLESNSGEIKQLMESHGFRHCAYDPWMRVLADFDDTTTIGSNHLWIRDRERVSARCIAGRHYRLLSSTI